MTELPTGTVTFVFTDVVGSSGMWESHHEAMQNAMASHDRIVANEIEANNGVLVKQTGDGVFAVFASAFDAVSGAVGIRLALHSQDWELLPSLPVRIGLHTGEAGIRDGDYFGSSVNRAARVMSIAEADEVLVSLATQEIVRDRLAPGLALIDHGDRELRGMSRPEHVFGVISDEEAQPSVLDAAPQSAVAPEDRWAGRHAAWIAVLPFENLSGDPDQEYFADGISEDIINGLGAWRSLRVISRTSSFRYRGTDMTLPKIAEELGVRFIIEGSVRKAGDRVRVTAKLIEASDRHQIWSDRFDGDISDIFDVQDEIALAVVGAIDPAVRSVAVEAASRVHPDDLDAWDRVQRGASEFFLYRPEHNIAARAHFEAAVAIDQNYAEAHSRIAWTYAMETWLNWTSDPAGSTERAYEAAKVAIQLDDRDAASHGALAMANYAMGRLDAVRTAADRSIELNPSYPPGLMMAATARVHGGEVEAGLDMVTRLIALSPQDPGIAWFFGLRAVGNFILGDLSEAVDSARASIKHRYGYLFGRLVLTAALSELGEPESARSEMDQILEIHPDFSLRFLHPYTFADESDRQRLVDGLRAAGFDG